MGERRSGNKVISLVGRAITVLFTEGPRAFSESVRERCKFNRVNLLVFGKKEYSASLPGKCQIDLEIAEITSSDDERLNELQEINVWKMSKAASLEKLKEGWLCFAAIHDGKVVASEWTFIGREFSDSYLDRTLILAHNEAYVWGAFCIPAMRGNNVIPSFTSRVSIQVALRHGKDRGILLTRANNKSAQQALRKMGWVPVGRLGFIEFCGVRFHYLWGREAFTETRRRFFVQAACNS